MSAPDFRQEVTRFYARLNGNSLPLGLGCAYIGEAGDAARQKRYQETLEQAYEAGFRYFDTARLYGGSEFRLGRFLWSVDRASVFVATKTTLPPALTPEEAAVHVRQNLRNSLERLGMEQIDLYQIHEAPALSQIVTPGGALEELLQAKEAGLIRYIGLATRWHDLSREAGAYPGFDTILTYLDYNLIDQTAARLIDFAAGRGKGVINATPLANGLLTGKDPRTDTETHGEVRRHRALATELYDFCRQNAISLLALALQYPLRNPGISITLTGPGDPDELQSTLRACRSEIPESIWEALHSTFGMHQPLQKF
ncbi:MAG TPA: aldo/keto reductase [Chthonomonadaceae bacterium]|nr:aldo/keto reductase [Chthonomonadaceae bacterium]